MESAGIAVMVQVTIWIKIAVKPTAVTGVQASFVVILVSTGSSVVVTMGVRTQPHRTVTTERIARIVECVKSAPRNGRDTVAMI
jgi:hypothetical protein